MGTEAVWVPLVMAAVAGTATYVDNRKQAKKADNLLASQVMRKSAKQREADTAVNQLIAATEGSTSEARRGSTLSQYLGAMRNAGQGTGQLLGLPGGGDAFQEAANDAALGIQASGERKADLYSRADAALLQRQDEAKGRGRTGDVIDLIKREDSGDDAVTDTKLRSIRSNPYLQAVANAARAYGAAYGGASGTAGGAAGGAGNIMGGSTMGRSNLYQGALTA